MILYAIILSRYIKTFLTNMNNSSKHDSVEVEETVKVQLNMHNKDYNCNT